MPDILLIILSAATGGLARLPLHSGWLSFISLIPLLYYLEKTDRKPLLILKHTFVYSAVNITLWMHWIWGVTSFGFVGIILLFALYYFVLFSLLQYVMRRLPKQRYVSFVTAFIVLEYMQNFGQFSFPWTNLGYALADYTVLIQAADIGGVTLLSLGILIINVMLYLAIKGRKLLLSGVVIIFSLWIGYGLYCLHNLKLETNPAKIAVMQPSIPQEDKWESRHFSELFRRYSDLTLSAAQDGAKLVIWPEAAMPVYLLRDDSYQPLVQNLCNNLNIDIFTGFPDVLPAPEEYPGDAYYYNAATLFKPEAIPEQPFYKMVLVPIGERMPWLKTLPFMWKLQFGQANWEYGQEIKYYHSANTVFSPQICFEIAFPELNRKMAFSNLSSQSGAACCPMQKVLPFSNSRLYSCADNRPAKIDYLVNITNDAWFGRSAGPWIHGMMAKYRAVENRIQIFRSANTGISMAIDPLGRSVKKTSLFEITQFSAPLYTCSKIPLYYYLSGWERLFCLLAIFLLIMALPDIPLFRNRQKDQS